MPSSLRTSYGGTYKGLRAMDGSFLQEPQCPQRLTLTYQSGNTYLGTGGALYNFLIYIERERGTYKKQGPLRLFFVLLRPLFILYKDDGGNYYN
jgi:hypothetical protein